MGPPRDFSIQSSGPARPHAGATLPSEADALTGFDALGDLDVQCSRLFSHSPVGADHRLLQRNLAGPALDAVFQIDGNRRVVVLALTVNALGAGMKTAAEQALEEIAKTGTAGVCKAAAAELKARVPARWRLKLLTLARTAPQLIVSGTLFGIFQNPVRLADLFELVFGARVLVDIRVIFARQLAVGTLDFVLSGIALQPQGLVVILKFHNIPLADPVDSRYRYAVWTAGFQSLLFYLSLIRP